MDCDTFHQAGIETHYSIIPLFHYSKPGTRTKGWESEAIGEDNCDQSEILFSFQFVNSEIKGALGL